MKIITIHYTTPYIGTIAKQGEHNQTELVFYLPDSFNGADFVNAEFVKRDGSTSVVDQLIPNNGIVTVPLTQDLTNVDGKMEIQLVAYKADGTEITEIAKSNIFTCKIRKSLNVLYGEDQPGVIERILAFISYWAEKLPEMWAKKHWHDNKALLDTITADDLGVKPDWNENDSASKNYIANRTHWDEDGIVTTEYTVEWTGTAPQGQFQPWDATELGIVLEEGEEYSLEVDGTTYIGACQKSTATVGGHEQEYFYIGNPHLYDPTQEDNHFPVLLIYDVVHTNPVWTLNVLLTDESLFGSDLTFQLGREETVYHKLSDNYLSNSAIDAIKKRHEHANKETILDKFANNDQYKCLDFDGNPVAIYGVEQIPIEPQAYYSVGIRKPLTWYRVGSPEYPALKVSARVAFDWAERDSCEYLLEFYTGESAVSYEWWTIFPFAHWVTPIVFEPFKHYQISLLNGVICWCASDYLDEDDEEDENE